MSFSAQKTVLKPSVERIDECRAAMRSLLLARCYENASIELPSFWASSPKGRLQLAWQKRIPRNGSRENTSICTIAAISLCTSIARFVSARTYFYAVLERLHRSCFYMQFPQYLQSVPNRPPFFFENLRLSNVQLIVTSQA